jgi:hypothetical protein
MRDFLLHKPYSVLGIVAAIHSIIYGVGYIFATNGFANTVLYKDIQQIMPPIALGFVFLAVGVAVFWAYLRRSKVWVYRFSYVQSIVWLFAFFMYSLHGSVILGAGIGLVWVLISGYTAMGFANQTEIVKDLLDADWKSMLD